MKASKIIVFLVVIILLGVGSYFLQKNKQDKALVAHNKKKFEQIKAAAQKSPTAGLLQMASAINKYHKSKGHYPKELIDLYPEFIPDKPFVVTFDWAYQSGKETYNIKRSDKRYFYSMGPDMRLKTGLKSGASSGKVAVVKTQKKTKTSSALAAAKTSPKVNMDVKKGSTVKTVSLVGKSTPTSKANSKKSSLKRTPEFVVQRDELKENEKFLLLINNSNLYIWKSNSGVIGFSNIQYPDEKELTIYKDKSWVTYQHHKKNSKQK